MRIYETYISGIALFLLIVIFTVFSIIICVINDGSFLSRDEVCQKNFGKDYVWRSGYRGADFCIDSSGIPKYPKTWKERKPNA